jgi:hypothetical protein
MDTGVTPAAAAFAVSGDTVTAVAWTSSTNLRLTGTGFAAAESLVYTKPATNAPARPCGQPDGDGHQGPGLSHECA